MPVCQACGIEFKTYAKINGVPKNLGHRKFCLGCSPFGQHNTRSRIQETPGECVTCGRPLRRNQTKYCCKRCSYKQSSNVYQNYEAQKARALSRKRMFVLRLGGKCSRCGYNKNLAALEFHHIDPREKDLKLDSRRMGNHAIEILEVEVAKCVLLCANCHREEHHPDMQS